MNPEQLAKSGSEHSEQRALFCWANMACMCGFAIASDMDSYSRYQTLNAVYPIPELKWLHAIPNGGARGNHVAAAQLKAEGVKAGVADIFLPVRRDYIHNGLSFNRKLTYSGLYIELKRKNAVPSDVSKEQRLFGDFVRTQGYDWFAAFGWRDAAAKIQIYLEDHA